MWPATRSRLAWAPADPAPAPASGTAAGTPAQPAPAPGTGTPVAPPAGGGPAPAPAPAPAAAAARDLPGWMNQLSLNRREALASHNFKNLDDFADHTLRLEKEAGARGVIVPDDKATPEIRQAFHKAIGVPDKPDAYELPSENVDPAFVNWARSTFHAEGVPAGAAKNIADKWQKFVEAHIAEQEKAAGDKLREEDAALRATWRGDYSKNIDITDRVATYLGWSKEAIGALAQREGYVKVREGFLKMAHMIDGSGPMPTGGETFHITTTQQAAAELERMQSDAAIAKALTDSSHPQHKTLNEKWERLQEIKSGLRMPAHLRGR